MIHAICVAGARPNLIKIKPVIDGLASLGAKTTFVHTGQHYDDAMSGVFLNDLGLRQPDRSLGVGSGAHAEQTARVMIAFEPVVNELRPDVVVVVGDVNSTLGCALVAAKAGAMVAHVEAGLRSRDWSMPEEVNRVVTDRVSDDLFAPSADAVANLRAEGYRPDQIHLVGNVMVDSLLTNLDRAIGRDTLARLGIRAGHYALVTLHRPANVDDIGVLGNLIEILGRLAEDIPVVFPVHPRTRVQMKALTVPASVMLVEPCGYLDFVALEHGAALVLTDSGGIQEETTVLGVPCLTLRDNTERPITVSEGTNQVVGRSPQSVLTAARNVLNNGWPKRCPALWDGRAGARIAEVLVGGIPQRRLRPTDIGRVMRILLVTHYFPPEIGAPQARLGELARAWADAGDDVTVLTGMPNHPTGLVPLAYRRRMLVFEHVDGYDIVRTWLYATPNEGFIKKTIGHLSFMVTSVLLAARRTGAADVVIVSSPTFFSIFGAWAIAKLKRAPLVIDVRDLWPAIFVELGVLTNPRLIGLLERLELWSYGQATEVVVVSDGFREDLIRRGVPSEKVTTIYNGADLERFSPDGDPTSGRKQLGVADDEVLALYLGAHGLSHGLDSVVDAAAILADSPGVPVRIALVGDGANRSAVVAQVERLGLRNVTLHLGVPRDDVPGLLAAADICLVPLRDVPLFSTFIPSKIFEYFAAGKAVIGALRGEAATILRDGGALVVEPGDPQALASGIAELARDADRRAAMGAKARPFVTEHFDRRQLATQYRAILARCTRSLEG